MANVIDIGGGAGGGSGSSVVPNPQGAATDTLVKLGIEGTIYDFAGSGSGGSSYSETELLSAPVQVGASSITLTDNISNYDLLVFEVGVFADNINQTFTSVALVSNTVNNPSDKTFIGGTVSANNNVYCVYFGIKYSSETQLTIIDSNRTGWSQAGQIISIKGIKYGSGSSSGHNYSTSEQVVGTWVDGSTIYEQSFAITNQTISTGWTVLVSGISIDKMISGEVCISGGGYDYTWNALYYNNGNIAVYNFLGGAIQSANGYVTIRYTKSTT